MNHGDRVPVAICTTSTPMATTTPIRPTMAPIGPDHYFDSLHAARDTFHNI
jgi:hypothetical protein